MNHQVEQLALRAGFNLHNDIIDGHNFNHEIEKFSELIVLKCAEIADTAEPFLSSDLIKQHFGVKE